jgi:glycosyltransferase involved in cell wall biosynthesis
VDGINAVIWTVAAEQVRLGHRVDLLVSDPPDLFAYRFAQDIGVHLLHIPANRLRFDSSIGPALIVEKAADIVHFHSVFIPRQATLASDLRRWGIPYVVTPHGGLMPHVLERSRLKKKTYSTLVEEARIRQAAAIAYVTPGGEDDIRRFVPGFEGPIKWVSNPVDVEHLASVGWRPACARPQLTFLGRYDVYHKGLDRLAEIARRVPEADFQLFGVDDLKTKRHLDAIRQYGPSNFMINDPVFGDEKLEILSRSSMYIQVSRWEALSISILEALALGVPTVISESMSMASMFKENDLGLVVSTEPDTAALQIRTALQRPRQLHSWSETSRRYARETFAGSVVARRVSDLYEEALEQVFSNQLLRFPLVAEGDGNASYATAGFADQREEEAGHA